MQVSPFYSLCGILFSCLLFCSSETRADEMLSAVSADRLALVVKDPSRLQETFLYPAPKVEDKTAYRKKYVQWLKYERNFKRDSVNLHGWFYERRKKPLIVYYGANSEDVSDELWWLHGLKKYAFLLVNYRGYGLSTGTPGEKACVEDAVAVLDKILKETKRSAKDVILIGRSLGTGVAAQVAAQRKVGRLILITPYDSVEAVAKRHFWFMPVSRYLKDNWNSCAVASQIKAKTTLIVAAKDELIPSSHALALKNSFSHEVKYVEVPEATHGDIVTKAGFNEILTEALSEPQVEVKKR